MHMDTAGATESFNRIIDGKTPHSEEIYKSILSMLGPPDPDDDSPETHLYREVKRRLDLISQS